MMRVPIEELGCTDIVMSWDSSHSTVSYTSISSEARSWSIPTMDPYEEAAKKALEQASPPLSPAYIADADLEKDLEEDPKEDPADYPADGEDEEEEEESFGDDADDEDEEEAFKEEDDDEEEEYLALADSFAIPIDDHVPSAEETKPFETYESARTPPSPRLCRVGISVRLLPPMAASMEVRIAKVVGIQLRAASPLPLPAPSSPFPLPATDHIEDVPKADVPPQKRLCLTAPTPSIRAIEERAMASIRVVNLRVNYQADDNRATVRAEIEVLRRERLAYKRDSSETRQALARSEAHNKALEAQIAPMETQLYRLEWQRQDADDHTTRAMMLIYDDDDALCYVDITTDEYFTKMPPKRTIITTTPTPMTDAQIKTLIAQEVADALPEIKANRTSINGDDSYDSGTGSKRTEQAARECTYSDFLKFQPLNFKGTEGVVSLTQWFEKMESIFHISNCTVACQIKLATCTLLGSA
ncbi:hypothetical protein Tco_1036737 [Tanacetum coccineum]